VDVLKMSDGSQLDAKVINLAGIWGVDGNNVYLCGEILNENSYVSSKFEEISGGSEELF
jgi:hypothetical protein